MEPTRLERILLRRPEKVVIRQQRQRLLARILEFAKVSIDDVVNDPRAKARVLWLYRIADAGEYESLRTLLHERVDREWFFRENR